MQDMSYITEFLIVFLILIALGIIYYYTKRYKKTTSKKNSYVTALEYIVEGDYKRAIQKFKEAVHENTENIDAYLYLGDLLREKGAANNALRIHKDLTLRTGITPEFHLKVQRSLMLDYENLGDFEQAARIAQTLLEEDNNYYREAANKLITFLERIRKWEAANHACIRYFRQIPLHLKKRMALHLVFKGLELLEKEGGHEARLKFKEALKSNPKCSAAYYYIGKSYYLEDRLEEAISAWKTLCEKIPEHAYIVFDYLERSWFELGNFAEAENLYNNLLASNSENIHAALALSEIYDKKGQQDRALEILDRMKNIHTDDSRINGFRVKILHNKGQYKSASASALDILQKYNFLTDKNYVCQECHYNVDEPLWICPQCKSIDSFIA